MKRTPSAIVILLVILGLLAPAHAFAEFTVPPGFDDQPVIGSVPAPTAIDWLPSGELLIATQGGVLFHWNGAGAAQPILDLSAAVCTGKEMGLLGLAVDPEFDSGSRFIYLYYTRRGSGECSATNRANRVARFTLNSGGIPGDEHILVDNVPALGGNHNGGDLQFDNSKLLYVSIGDGGQDLETGAGQNGNGNARRLDLLNGKILRINKDGSIPAGNPFQGPGTVACSATGGVPGTVQPPQDQAQNQKKKKNQRKRHKSRESRKEKRVDRRDEKRERRLARRRINQPPGDPGQGGSSLICQEIYATGLRNPFRLAFDSNDMDGPQRFYINDVGGGAWEEIDVGAPGADYGWNVREGPCVIGSTTNCSQPSGFVEPIHAYDHSLGCRTITGGAFVPNSANWPDQFDGDYLFADLACGNIFSLDGASGLATPFAEEAGAIHLRFGPDGDLYYTTYENGGQVRKISN